MSGPTPEVPNPGVPSAGSGGDPAGCRRAAPILIGVVVVLVLMMAAVPMVGIVAAIAIPNFVAMQLKAKRSELPGNISGIRIAELASDASGTGLVAVGSRAEAEAEIRAAGGRTLRPWRGGAGWDTLGWRPETLIRGAYWVEVDGAAFTVWGIADVDDNGTYAEYTATRDTTAAMTSSPNDY